MDALGKSEAWHLALPEPRWASSKRGLTNEPRSDSHVDKAESKTSD